MYEERCQQNKNHIIPKCNKISYIEYNHPFVHTNGLNKKYNHNVKAKKEEALSLRNKTLTIET